MIYLCLQTVWLISYCKFHGMYVPGGFKCQIYNMTWFCIYISECTGCIAPSKFKFTIFIVTLVSFIYLKKNSLPAWWLLIPNFDSTCKINTCLLLKIFYNIKSDENIEFRDLVCVHSTWTKLQRLIGCSTR